MAFVLWDCVSIVPSNTICTLQPTNPYPSLCGQVHVETVSGVCSVQFALYRKPHCIYQYVSPNSCHIQNTLNSWVACEIARMFNRNSRDKTTLTNVQFFFDKLRNRGYHNSKLQYILKKLLKVSKKL